MIFVATDYLTRYAEKKALLYGTATKVAEFFLECTLLRHGASEGVITDRETAFSSRLMQEGMYLSIVKKRRITDK